MTGRKKLRFAGVLCFCTRTKIAIADDSLTTEILKLYSCVMLFVGLLDDCSLDFQEVTGGHNEKKVD